MSDKQPDELIEAYRRASASDADRPSAGTRAAILAEAAAAARRNAPAANQSRYWMRAVAGIAVLGIGVVLWRQTQRLPGEAPMMADAPATQPLATQPLATQALESVAKAERGPAPEAAAVPGSVALEPAAIPEKTAVIPERPAVAGRAADSVRLAEAPLPAVPATSPPQLAQNVPDEDLLAEVSVTGARIQTPDERAAAAPAAPAAPPVVTGPAAPATVDGATLLREHFPAQYQSDVPHAVWLVLNAAGVVLQSGELAPGQRVPDLASQLARSPGDRMPGPWQVQMLRNARGQTIELSIARVP